MRARPWEELLKDRLAALLFAAFVAFVAIGLFGLAHDQIFIFRHAPGVLGAIGLLNTIVLIAFSVQQAVLILVRAAPVARAGGLLPRLTAIAGATCGLLLLFAGRDALDAWRGLLSLALSLTGTIGAIATLTWLGRSFSVFPQARQLVTTGPYRTTRHPLYLMEDVAFLGIVLQFRLPWALAVFALSIGLQLARIGFEEEVLRRAFPAYEKYRQTTWRLLPPLY